MTLTTKKRSATRSALCSLKKLFGFDCTSGATVFASAAINASIGINHVLICAFGDSTYGASSSASAAAYTFVGNSVCHNNSSHKNFYLFKAADGEINPIFRFLLMRIIPH
jgi:hypothetical protein